MMKTQLDHGGIAGTDIGGAGTLFGCLLIALLLCIVQISGSKMLIAACLAAFLAFHFWSCFQNDAMCVLLFFLPWSPLLRTDRGSISFFTIALLLTCLYYWQRDGFRLALYQILVTAFLAVTTLIAKAIRSNPIENHYLFFFMMLLLFPCVAKGLSGAVSFSRLTLFFACGIIMAALSARQIAAYPNISQYIKVDSYLKITRLSGYYRDPNFYCAHITACLAGVQLLMSRERRRSRQIVWIGVMMVLVYCGLLSASKSFVVVLACLFLVWVPVLLTGGHVKRGIAILAGVACAAAVMLLSAAVQDMLRMVMSRFSYAANVSDLTTHRSEIWRMYLHELSRDPVLMLLGSGFTSVTLGTKASHNTIIQGVFQFGLIGLPVLCAWLVMTLKRTSGRSGCRRNAFLLMCVGVVLPWMALDILFFDEFFLLPVYAVIGAGYAASETNYSAGNVVRAVERTR